MSFRARISCCSATQVEALVKQHGEIATRRAAADAALHAAARAQHEAGLQRAELLRRTARAEELATVEEARTAARWQEVEASQALREAQAELVEVTRLIEIDRSELRAQTAAKLNPMMAAMIDEYEIRAVALLECDRALRSDRPIASSRCGSITRPKITNSTGASAHRHRQAAPGTGWAPPTRPRPASR